MAAAWPFAARAQQPNRMRRIGVLLPSETDDPEYVARMKAFTDRLVELGWIEGRNIQIERRWGSANAEQTRKFAAELVSFAPDVILAPGSRESAWAERAAVAGGTRRRSDRISQDVRFWHKAEITRALSDVRFWG